MVTLNMWILAERPVAKQIIEQEINSFKEEHPGLDIKINIVPWRVAWDFIISIANQRRGPDILQIGSTWNATLAYLGVLKDITREVYDSNILADVFIPAAWSSCHFPASANISSLPWFVDIRAMYYRQDIFRELGMSGDDLEDWASFEKVCDNIKGYEKGERTIEVIGVSGLREPLLLQNIAPWIWGAGGDFLTPDGKNATFNSQKALNGVEFYINLIKKGYISHSVLKLATEEVNINFFDKGDYAICIPGSLSEYNLYDPRYSSYISDVVEYCMYSLFPAGPAGRFNFCGGSNLAISSFSEHPKEAWEFIKFLTSYESQCRYPRMLNMFPSLLECFDDTFRDKKQEWKGFRDPWKYGRAFPNVTAWGAVEALLVECFGKIFSRIQEGDYNIDLVKADLDRTALDVDDLLVR